MRLMTPFLVSLHRGQRLFNKCYKSVNSVAKILVKMLQEEVGILAPHPKTTQSQDSLFPDHTVRNEVTSLDLDPDSENA